MPADPNRSDQTAPTGKSNIMGDMANTMNATSSKEIQNKMDSVNRTSIISQFDPQGNILTANENFLKTMGYPLNEIKGKHHRIFYEAAYIHSQDYKDFWFDLVNGKEMTRVCKQLKKNGESVWLDASYIPIKDGNGRVFKIFMIAPDRSHELFKNFLTDLSANGAFQLVVDFNMEGYVLNANENFLKVMGYTHNEIVGQHHRMFCDTGYANSPEYQAFWISLNKGQYDVGGYKYMGKDGREVWIQASYNLIRDLNGAPFKVTQYAIDVTQRKILNREIMFLVKANILDKFTGMMTSTEKEKV